MPAQLPNGDLVRTNLAQLKGQVISDSLVGKLLPNNELVQCQLENGEYRTIFQQNYTVIYSIRTADEIEAMLGL
ncbi:MAG: hypothetical protein A3E88_08100 [Legionellales bacterium RIFCSPHIGHO2_12_FULL_35_11]|nr:MAG: hypothetical protein A3E88_08100 [Legionellales bacterium RIFCSPHIGHO2_12_FULL_35_11]